MIDIDNVVDIAKVAGQKILEIYESDFEHYTKEDKSPLTEADLQANAYICSELMKAYPDIPILSEEGGIPHFRERVSWERFFLIDPLDGTKEFIKKNGEFTVNIALIENRFPAAGVIYVPTQSKTYMAQKGKGAFRIFKGKKEPIQVQPVGKPTRVVSSRSHDNLKTREFVDRIYDNYEFTSVGSSLKFCYVAEGFAQLYPRLGPTSEWDTAAAQCVVEEAGGSVIRVDTQERFFYNKEDILNPGFLVLSDPAMDLKL